MSIITKNEAFMLRRPDVIDLKYIAAKKYVSSVEGTDTRFYTLISRMKKYIVISALAWLLLLSLFGWGILIPNTSEASNTLENTAFLDRFPDNSEGVRVIGCYNDHTRKIREGSSCTASGDKNIMLPPRSHVEVWLKYYNPRQIVNRLGIVNFESSFREDV